LNELSLFTGAGGGVLGTTLLGWKHRGYVEWDNYCQRIISQRILDGILDEAPIFCDVRAFISEGYAASYTGMVDVITAGFPCQPFSVAGKRKGVDDERNMWPATADVIRIVRPRFVLLENVPGIREYLPVVIRDLRRLGYSVRRPLQLGADDVGGKHRRKRIWIMANAECDGWESRGTECTGQQGGSASVSTGNVADAECLRRREPAGYSDTAQGSLCATEREEGAIGIRSGCENVADTCEQQRNRWLHRFSGWGREPLEALSDARERGREEDGLPVPESLLGRVADGVASRVDRLKALGNGQVPQVVAAAWELLARN
jgi:DNA (cytosine-5)-methyltransferase 1